MRRTVLSVLVPLAMLPAGWPHHLAVGVSDPPGDAAALLRRARDTVDESGAHLARPVVSAGYRTYALWLLMLIYVVSFLDRQVINILAEPIKNELGLSDNEPPALLLIPEPEPGSPALSHEALWRTLVHAAIDRELDFARHDRYIARFVKRTHTPVVLWQLPLGDTLLSNTWGHYRDNRLQWWLGDPSGRHLRATRDAGVIGLLFGGGADGTTSSQTDGGFFYRLARVYLAHPLRLG